MEINVDYIREHLNIKLKKIEVLSEFFIKLIKIKKELLTFDEIKFYNVFTPEEIYYNDYRAKQKRIHPIYLINRKLKDKERYRIKKEVTKIETVMNDKILIIFQEYYESKKYTTRYNYCYVYTRSLNVLSIYLPTYSTTHMH